MKNQIVNFALVTEAIAAGETQRFKVPIDNVNPVINGAMVNLIADGGDPNLRIGLKQGTRDIEEPHHVNNWKTDAALNYKERVRPLSINTSGNELEIVIEAQADLTAAKIDFAFLVSNKPDDTCHA